MSLPERFPVLFERYADGVLDASGRAELRDMLRRHPECQAAFVAGLTLHAAIRAHLGQALSPSARLDLSPSRRLALAGERPARPWWRRRMLVLLAGMAAAAGLAMALGFGPGGGTSSPDGIRLLLADGASIDGRTVEAGAALPPGALLRVVAPGRARFALASGTSLELAQGELRLGIAADAGVEFGAGSFEARVETPLGAPPGVGLALADGSRLRPAAHTDLRLAHAAGQGGLEAELVRGGVEIDAAHQPAGRPFRIRTPMAEAEIVGTRLSLQADAEGTRLDVLEGLVHFTDRLRGGQREIAAGANAEVRRTADLVVPLAHGQDLQRGQVGRAGAARLGLPGFRAELETIDGDQVYTTSQTLRNQRFTGKVLVSAGDVRFEFCSFEHAPEAASAQLRQYAAGGASGHVSCSWCDFDPGLRGHQGRRYAGNVQFGERGANAPSTGAGFALYRCRLSGCGIGIAIHQYLSEGSSISECLIESLTSGGGGSPEGLEVMASGGFTVLRSRIALAVSDQACLDIMPGYGQDAAARPITIRDCYLNGGGCPVTVVRDPASVAAGLEIRRVRFVGNRFGDASRWGRLCNFDYMDVTSDPAYAEAHPDVIYWARSNVWAPDGEGVTSPARSPAGDVPAGLPHAPGAFIDQRNFFGGSDWEWKGRVLP